MRTDVVNSENVWMIEGGSGPGFLLESIQPVRVSSKVSWQNFDRNVTVKSPVARAPHLAHAAFTDLGDNRVLSDRSVGGNCFAHITQAYCGKPAFLSNAAKRRSSRSGFMKGSTFTKPKN
jgi:hypothetical protein